MTAFQIREVETIIDIAWEGFSVYVWASDEYDSLGNRFWYFHGNALNFGRTTSRAKAVEVGKVRLEEMILDANKPYAPHSTEFLNSIRDPFVGPVSRTLLVKAAGREVRIHMETDYYCSHRWTTRSTDLDVGEVASRREAISRAKRHLLKLMHLYGPSTPNEPNPVHESPLDDDIPF